MLNFSTKVPSENPKTSYGSRRHGCRFSVGCALVKGQHEKYGGGLNTQVLNPVKGVSIRSFALVCDFRLVMSGQKGKQALPLLTVNGS